MQTDPIQLEILGKKFAAVLDEMYFGIQRASRSSYVKEAADFSTAVLDVDGNVFAYPPSATFNFLVDSYFKDTLDAIGTFEPGDVILTNDPYMSGGLSTHLPDFQVIRPYFAGGKLIGFGWSFVHCADVAGAVPTSMSPALTDIFQEGLRIPPMKIVKAGVPNDEVFAIVRSNTRTPETTMGDLKAMMGALSIGEKRFAELADRFGVDAVVQAAADLQDYAAARARDVFRMIPDGAYTFWDYMDDDYVSRIPVRIRVTMVVEDGNVNLDLTGTDPQVKSAYNVPSMNQRIYWLTFRLTSFLTTFDPDIPKNTGMYRGITITHQKGSILNAEFPDAVNIRASAPWRLFDAITGALIKARPDLMPATTGGAMFPFAFAEPTPSGSRKVEVIEPLRCGMGAFAHRDGVDGRDNSLNNMRNHPVEMVETNSSVLVIEYGIRTDGGGPGKFRGGAGQFMTIEALSDEGVIVGRGQERLRFQPWGISGGSPGKVLKVIFNMGLPGERELGKIHEVPMRKGDRLTILMPGGGGYGNAFERDPAMVLEDVENGFVSIEGAESDYGVIIRDGAIDMAATEARRGSPALTASNEPFGFGPARLAWDAVFDDDTMMELNRRLYALPKSRRQLVRRELFETVVPALATGGADLDAALSPPEETHARLIAEMDRLLPATGADLSAA